MDEIEGALAALDEIERALAEGRARFNASRDRLLAMTYLWINVGSMLKQFCRVRGIGVALEPYRGPIRMRDRLAYGPIAQLDPSIVWETSREHARGLHTHLTSLNELR